MTDDLFTESFQVEGIGGEVEGRPFEQLMVFFFIRDVYW